MVNCCTMLSACTLFILFCCLYSRLQLVAADGITNIGTKTLTGPLYLNVSFDGVSAPFMENMAFSFTLQNPLIQMNTMASYEDGLARLALAVEGKVDFIVTSTVYSESYLDSVGFAQFALITQCVVPVYRLDSIASYMPPVVFSLPIVVDILLGSLTVWNDSRIQALNPLLTLPYLNITIVYESNPSGVNSALAQTLASINEDFAFSVYNSTYEPNWQTQLYAASVACLGYECVASLVTSINGAFGFSIYSAATDIGVNVGNIVNEANNVVSPSLTTLTNSLIEMATLAIQDVDATAILPPTPLAYSSSLQIPSGYNAWPISTSSWVCFPLAVSNPNLIERRAALTAFLLFAFNSNLAEIAMQMLEVAPLPSQIQEGLGLLTTLEAMTCNTTNSFTEAVELNLTAVNVFEYTTTLSASASFTWLPALTEYWTYYVTDVSIDFACNLVANSAEAFQTVLTRESTFALLEYSELSSQDMSTVEELRTNGSYLFLPLLTRAIAPAYSYRVATSFYLPTGITITIPVLADLLQYRIFEWNNSQILALNPDIERTSFPPSPVRVILECADAQTTVGLLPYDFFVELGNYNQTLQNNASESIINALCNSSLYDPNSLREAVPQGYFPTTTDTAVMALLASAIGAVSVIPWSDQVENDVGLFAVQGPNQIAGVLPSYDSMNACWDAFDPNTFQLDVTQSQSPECYAFTYPLYLMLPTSFVDYGLDQCAYARTSLQLFMFLAGNPQLEPTMQYAGASRASNIPAAWASILAQLNDISCINPVTGESNTILVSLPVTWSLTHAVTIAGVVLSSLGLAAAAAILVIISFYWQHPAIQATSPGLLATSVCGIITMFVAAILVASPASSATCSLWSWTAQLGTVLIYAPIVLKTYRVYHIVSGNKLNVIKISNRRLYVMLLAGLCVEVVLLTAAQIVSPVQPITIARAADSPTQVYQYNMCSMSGAGIVILSIEGAIKGLLLLVGSLMIISTRRVHESYNESSSFSLILYNGMCSVCLIAVVTSAIDAIGDTLIILLLTFFLWIAYFTLAVLASTPLSAIWSQSKAALSTENEARDVDTNKFSLLSAKAFTKPNAIVQYLAAVESQLAQAKLRYQMLKAGDKYGREWKGAGVERAGQTRTLNASDTKMSNSSIISVTTKAVDQPVQYQQNAMLQQSPIKRNISEAAVMNTAATSSTTNPANSYVNRSSGGNNLHTRNHTEYCSSNLYYASNKGKSSPHIIPLTLNAAAVVQAATTLPSASTKSSIIWSPGQQFDDHSRQISEYAANDPRISILSDNTNVPANEETVTRKALHAYPASVTAAPHESNNEDAPETVVPQESNNEDEEGLSMQRQPVRSSISGSGYDAEKLTKGFEKNTNNVAD